MDFSRRRNTSRLEGPSSTLIEISARDVSLTIFCEPSDEAARTSHLQEAFDAYTKHSIGETKWMTLDEIRRFQPQPQQSVHFVCDPFDGPAYSHVRTLGQPVWGPLVLLRCLRDKRALPLSAKGQPIYSQAMKDVVATFSSVAPARRAALTERVEAMGGRVEAALNNTVTHVVCDEVGSKKYIVGAQRGLALQTTAWIDHVWEVTQHELKHAISVAEQFKTPMFASLTVTSSGLGEDEKAQLMKLITDNGGNYTGKLTKANTHLVTREAKGAKFTAANKWQLHIVSPDWVQDSVKRGFMLDPIPYRVGEFPDMTAGNNTVMNSSITSVASTVASARSVLSEKTINVMSVGGASSDPAYSEVLRLSKDDVSSAGQFLDGCSVHVFGVRDKALLDRLHQLINQAGGLREDAFNDGVTHIITIPSASGLAELQRNIESSFGSPVVLLPSWLVACVRQKSLVPPASFVVPGFDAPLDNDNDGDDEHCHGGPNNASVRGKGASDAAALGIDTTSTSTTSTKMNSIMSSFSHGVNSTMARQMTSASMSRPTAAATNVTCLAGKCFCFTKELRAMYLNVVHDLPWLREGIESLGGRLLDSDDAESCKDQQVFSVYANVVSPSPPTANAITILHLESVVKQRHWIDPSESAFFRVVHAPKSDVPNGAMAGVVVTPTGFNEREISGMTRVLALFGASLQSVMVRTSKPDKEQWATSHLVCATNRSNGKLDAAKRWKVPAVTFEWVLACAREGRRVGVKDYLVDASQWDTLPDTVRRSPRKPPPETPVERKKRPIDLQVTPSQTSQAMARNSTPNAAVDDVSSTEHSTVPANKKVSEVGGAGERRGSGSSVSHTPVLSSQRMREIYEEAGRFKTPKRSIGLDVDSPGLPKIGADKISEMVQHIRDSPLHTYEVPEASFEERCSQAVSVKSALPIGRPLAEVVALLDEDGLQPTTLELKMSIERLGGWICHTVERCTVVVLPPSRLQNDKSRVLSVTAQRLDKPLVGVEWVWAAIDKMAKPPIDQYPPDYMILHGGPYIRSKTLKDYAPRWDDSDLDISLAEGLKKKASGTPSVAERGELVKEDSSPVVDEPSIGSVCRLGINSGSTTGTSSATTTNTHGNSNSNITIRSNSTIASDKTSDNIQSIRDNGNAKQQVDSKLAAFAANEASTIENELDATPERRATLRLRKRSSSSASASGSEVAATPIVGNGASDVESPSTRHATAISATKDPLRDLLCRRNSNRTMTPTRRLSRATLDDAGRSQQQKRSQSALASQGSTGSVLADIETQPEDGITYGGTTAIPTSTQLYSTLCGDPVDPNFGDVSMVRPCASDSTGSTVPAVQKRSREAQDDERVGKKFRKNCVQGDVTCDQSKVSPLSSPRPVDKLFALYHLDDETDNRCRELIAELGGHVVDELSTDASGASAGSSGPEKIIIVDPTNARVFKKSSLLQQLASGGWILSPAYLDDSSAAGHFLSEADYMLGLGSKGQMVSSSAELKAMADRFACWPRWRQLRLERGTGAFNGWHVALFSASAERERGHRRLLMAGGARILDVTDTEGLRQTATHVFVAKTDPVKANQLRSQLGTNVLIVAPEYMLHYLSNAEVNPSQFTIK